MLMFTLLLLLGVGAVIYQITRSKTANRRVSLNDATSNGTAADQSIATTRAHSGSPSATVVLTTGEVLPSREIAEILDIVTYQGTRSTNAWQQFLQGSNAQDTLSQMRRTCLHGLRSEAALLGADAVVCVRIDPFEHRDGILMMSASGTAVRTVGGGGAAAGGEVDPLVPGPTM
jgi:uncharacterized protein YbjQ (UPF0145 family)